MEMVEGIQMSIDKRRIFEGGTNKESEWDSGNK